DWRSRASATALPQEVKISDITEASAVISWITPDLDTEGWVQYSDQSDVGDGSQIVQDLRDVRSGSTKKMTTHYVTLSSLSAGTTYYFVIGSGDTTYKDEQDQVFEFTTPVSSMAYNALDIVRGSVSNGTDESCIVYVILSNGDDKSFPTAVLTNDTGGFSAYLSNIRDTSLEAGFEYSDATELTIFAQGGDVGGAVYKTSVADALTGNPISITMDSDYSVTDVFAEVSSLAVGSSSSSGSSSTSTGSTATGTGTSTGTSSSSGSSLDEDGSGGEQSEDPADAAPTVYAHIPLTALASGSSSSTGISNIKVTNVTENSFSVVWTSGSQEQGYITYGSTVSNLSEQGSDDRDSILTMGSYYMHHISVLDLTPETTYYYVIHSGNSEYDNDGTPYQITLPATQSSPPEYDSVLGQVTGSGSADAVVVGKVISGSSESSEVSTVVGDNGGWTLSIGGIRSQDYSSYFDYGATDSLGITGMTKGDQETTMHTIGDIGEDVLGIALEMVTGSGGAETAAFERGLYAMLASAMSSLPETALNGLTAIGLTISILMIGYGSILLYGVYSGEKHKRWEENVMSDLDI
ncbi:MAG: fibronectin type III domain-containing protein, partial [Patescibacteria group bacterium]|nr:fibronectin type III domain-containing protein [Patescibacteria group bacterium]